MSNSPQDPNKPEDQPRYGQNPPPGPPDTNQQQPWQAPEQPPRPQYGESAPAQYGQPAAGQQYGQQPYGAQAQDQNQPPSPYGYQAAQPSGYGYPGGTTEHQYQQGPISRPKEVTIAFWLLIAAAVVWAISTIGAMAAVGSPQMQSQFEAMMNQEGVAGLDPEAFAGIAAVTLAVLGLIVIGLYLLVAFMVRKGKNWARITGAVLAVLSLLFLYPFGLLSIAVLLGIAAVVLLFMPASNIFFNAHKARKQGAFGR